MKQSRTLVVKREVLAELTTDDMRRIVGGTHLCTTDNLTHGNTCEAKCEAPTNPINHCLTLDTCTPLTFPTA